LASSNFGRSPAVYEEIHQRPPHRINYTVKDINEKRLGFPISSAAGCLFLNSTIFENVVPVLIKLTCTKLANSSVNSGTLGEGRGVAYKIFKD